MPKVTWLVGGGERVTLGNEEAKKQLQKNTGFFSKIKAERAGLLCLTLLWRGY